MARPRRPAGLVTPPMRDERGGAVSLWVILMVPVAAFAAVAAMAGPQRLAARAGMQDAADDLATFAVAWRDGTNQPSGKLPTFPMNCEPGAAPGGPGRLGALQQEFDNAEAELKRLGDEGRVQGELEYDEALERRDQAQEALDAYTNAHNPGDWVDACELVRDALVRDLGRLGVASHSMSGAYSDSLSDSQRTVPTPEPDWPEDWPCIGAGGMVVSDAVHASLAGDWQDAGWAASQVWPDGFRVAGESTAALAQRSRRTLPTDRCEPTVVDPLTALDDQGQPVWLDDPDHSARKLAHSVSHTPLSE